MAMILTIYVAISVTFSVGFVAGAWWASRARADDDSSFGVETIDRSDDQSVVLVLGRRSSANFGKSAYR